MMDKYQDVEPLEEPWRAARTPDYQRMNVSSQENVVSTDSSWPEAIMTSGLDPEPHIDEGSDDLSFISPKSATE